MAYVEPIPEFEKLKAKWYYNYNVYVEITKYLKWREAVFISTDRHYTERCMKINHSKFLLENWRKTKFMQCCMNIYNSVGHVPSMPMFSFNRDKKLEQQQAFNIDFEKYLTGYDLFLDIDNEDLGVAIAQGQELAQLFSDYKVPYSLRFSGRKGVHIVVSDEDLPQSVRDMGFADRAGFFKLFAGELKRAFGVTSLDLGIYDLRRIMKTPYSVVYPFYYIALPLSDDDIKNFSLDLVFLPNWIDRTGELKGRGLLKRAGNPENLLNLMSYIEEQSIKERKLFSLFKSSKRYFEVVT